MRSSSGTIPLARPASTGMTARDHWGHCLARLGIHRNRRRVSPGLYSVGNPGRESPVLVTAGYSLSFDALRRELEGIDAWILVLETFGINVWCAAGKGTFGTDELVHRIQQSGLKEVVRHRRLILPQLGAAGVSAHEVRIRSGFRVDYGPVRAADLPFYLQTGEVTMEMRRVKFDLKDRMMLIPVEMTHLLLPTLGMGIAAWLLGGWMATAALAAAVGAGAMIFPILLPWIPSRDFSSRGYVLGVAAVLPFAIASALNAGPGSSTLWIRIAASLGLVMALSTVTAFLALNFTGSTSFSSKSGVRREMRIYIPVMAGMIGGGLALMIVGRVL